MWLCSFGGVVFAWSLFLIFAVVAFSFGDFAWGFILLGILFASIGAVTYKALKS